MVWFLRTRNTNTRITKQTTETEPKIKIQTDRVAVCGDGVRKVVVNTGVVIVQELPEVITDTVVSALLNVIPVVSKVGSVEAEEGKVSVEGSELIGTVVVESKEEIVER